MNETALQTTDSCQYLGIHIQSNLKWNMQSHHAASKASRTLGFIQRNFHHASSNIKKKLYLTLVRPHLEYGIAAWDPYFSKTSTHLKKSNGELLDLLVEITPAKPVSPTCLKPWDGTLSKNAEKSTV